MKNITLTKNDINNYINRRKNYYFAFFLCIAVAIIISIVIIKTNDEYISVLSYTNKLYLEIVKGEVNLVALASKIYFVFSISLLIYFIVCLNYYTSLISYFIITYQTILLCLSIFSIISLYGIVGAINCIIIIIPINLFNLLINIYCITNFIIRSEQASKYKTFNYGFNRDFFIEYLLGQAMLLILSIIAGIIIPTLLKNANFIIF